MSKLKNIADNFKHLTDKDSKHSYLDVYNNLFSDYLDSHKILEIGVASGGSIGIWLNYFEKAEIHSYSPSVLPAASYHPEASSAAPTASCRRAAPAWPAPCHPDGSNTWPSARRACAGGLAGSGGSAPAVCQPGPAASHPGSSGRPTCYSIQ